jgi:oligopeptide/dipeptide ABC transporter ATP-binding protein
MIFQDPVASLDPLMKVGPQIAESLLVHEAAKGRSTTRKDANARALEVMKQVGIPDAPRRFNQYPFELSGGMCQRIVIAIAIVCRPEVLLADEPTTALDVTIQAQILDLLKRLRDQAGTSIVIVTHDMGVVADVADRVAVMYAGRVVESGEVHELFAHPRHPYTRMLLGTMHALEHGKPKATLSTIRGTVPPPQEWPSTCRFAGRCPVALDRCSTEPTPVFFSETSAGHSWACWNSEAAEQAT